MDNKIPEIIDWVSGNDIERRPDQDNFHFINEVSAESFERQVFVLWSIYKQAEIIRNQAKERSRELFIEMKAVNEELHTAEDIMMIARGNNKVRIPEVSNPDDFHGIDDEISVSRLNEYAIFKGFSDKTVKRAYGSLERWLGRSDQKVVRILNPGLDGRVDDKLVFDIPGLTHKYLEWTAPGAVPVYGIGVRTIELFGNFLGDYYYQNPDKWEQIEKTL